MSSHIWNRALLIGTILYGAGLYVFASVAASGLFVFGMSGYAPGLLCVGELVIGYVLAAAAVGWFVARRTRTDFVRANRDYPPRVGAWSGALAVGLPYLVLIFLPIVGLSLYPGTWNSGAVLGWLGGLLVISGLGALGGALAIWVGDRVNRLRLYRIAAVVAGAIVFLSVGLLIVAFAGDMQRSSQVSPAQAATRAAYEAQVSASWTRQAGQDAAVRANATAATNARATVLPTAPKIAWRDALSESFSQNTKGWEEGKRQDYSGRKMNQEIRDGKYRWTIETKKPGYETAISDFWSISVFQASVTGQRTSGAEDCGYGVYLSPFGFVIRDSGEWFWGDTKSGEFRVVLQGKSAAILSKQPNRILVEGNGPRYTVFVNDAWVGQVNIDATDKSDPGVMMENARAGTCAVDFDDFQVRVPQ